MNRKTISLLLAVLLLLGTCLIATGCNENENVTTNAPDTESTEADTSDSTDSTDSSNSTDSDESTTSITDSGDDNSTESTESTENDTTETTEDIGDDIYENGGDVKHAGFSWYDDAYAYTENIVDTSKAKDISANDMKALLTAQTLEAGDVYRVTDALVLDSDTKYYGMGAAIIATGGLIIKDAHEIVVKDLVVLGSISVENSTGITFFRFDAQSEDTAFTVDEKSSDIVFKSCRIKASDTAVISDASLTSFYQCYVTADKAFELAGDDVAIQDCHIVALTSAVKSAATQLIVKDNLIEMSTDGIGITLLEGSYNSLVALNIIKNAQVSVSVTGTYNTVVLLNSAITVSGNENTNLYVVENQLGGRIKVENNNYLLCDGNGFPSDGKNHIIYNKNNTNKNGNNVTDIGYRPSVGANEDILPHTNKDLFIDMERRLKVRDASIIGKEYSLNDYIRQCAKSSSVVIVPPGAYTTTKEIAIEDIHKNTTIYAYGVYDELSEYTSAITVTGTSNINVRGLTMGFVGQTSGQVHVVEKLGSSKVRVVTAAGYINDFGKSNTSVFSGSFADLFEAGEMYNWINDYYTKAEHNDDGTMTLTLKSLSTYLNTKVGDVITCRLNVNSASSVKIDSSTNVNFKDCVLYGHSSALAFVAEGSVTEGVSIERFHNTVHSNPVISKETYEQYEAWEKQYNVDLEIYQDENGLYRGSKPRIGSCDATHINGTKQGVSVTSSLFENMCDDGTNQHAASGRLESVVDNNDGTATITYRSNLSDTYFIDHGATRGHICPGFTEGSKILIYAPDGRIVCDTKTLSASNYLGARTFTMKYGGITRTCDELRFTVTVPSNEVDFNVIKDYDLTDNSPAMTNKIIVDNLSATAAGFTFDNVLIQNIRSRAMLIKTTDVMVKNCTFRNIATTGILLKVEPNWGESTVARDVVITGCLFDHVGYHGSLSGETSSLINKTHAPIAIQSVSKQVGEKSLPIENITVDNCKFINNVHMYGIVVNSAQNVKILSNTFESISGQYKNTATLIDVSISMNVEIVGNIFPKEINTPIRVANYQNVYGADVTDENGNRLFPDQ